MLLMSARLSLVAENSLFDEIHFFFLFQPELKLYHHLMETRADLARRNSTAPYAICNEKTLQKIAKSRPSTEARLRNIDGVNQVNTLSIVPSLFSVAVLEMGLQNSRVFVTKSPNFVSIY
jgi:superfamily II DNA helicase RecQ